MEHGRHILNFEMKTLSDIIGIHYLMELNTVIEVGKELSTCSGWTLIPKGQQCSSFSSSGLRHAGPAAPCRVLTAWARQLAVCAAGPSAAVQGDDVTQCLPNILVKSSLSLLKCRDLKELGLCL